MHEAQTKNCRASKQHMLRNEHIFDKENSRRLTDEQVDFTHRLTDKQVKQVDFTNGSRTRPFLAGKSRIVHQGFGLFWEELHATFEDLAFPTAEFTHGSRTCHVLTFCSGKTNHAVRGGEDASGGVQTVTFYPSRLPPLILMGSHVSFDPPKTLSAAQRAHETPNLQSVLAANLSGYHGCGCPRRILEFCGCSDCWTKRRTFLNVSLGASFVVLKSPATMIAFLPYYIATNPTLTRYHTLPVGSRERAPSLDSPARPL